MLILRISLSVLMASVTLMADGDIAALSWMAGCWEGKAGSLTVEEQWTKPTADLSLGISRNRKQSKTVFHEFMRIDRQGADVFYTPRIGSSEKPVSFKLIRQSDGEVVFENAAHDFPQRILYRKVEGGLHARIEGMDKGKARAEDFPMRRVSCE